MPHSFLLVTDDTPVWTPNRHPITLPGGWAMECLLHEIWIIIDHYITGPNCISFQIWYGKWIIWNSDFCKNCINFYFCRSCITSSCLLIHFFLFYRYVKPSRRINPWSCVGMSFWWLITVNGKVPVPYHCCSNHCSSFQDSLIANIEHVEYCLMLFLIRYSKMWKCIHATFWTQSTHWPLQIFMKF